MAECDIIAIKLIKNGKIMSKHIKAREYISRIQGKTSLCLKMDFIYQANKHLDKSASNFYACLALMLGVGVFATHTVYALANEGLMVTILGGLLLSIFLTPIVVLSLMIGTKNLTDILFSYGLNVFSPSNIFKAVKFNREIKKKNILELISKNDFKNKELVEISERIGFNLDGLEPLTTNQINSILDIINILPSSVKKEVKNRLLNILKGGGTLRKRDEKLINEMLDVFKGDDMEVVNIIERLEKDVSDTDIEKDMDEVLTLTKENKVEMRCE